ncbi:hypothetical protein AXW83_12990 [Bosea sp. PAMC 26642]|nr:hypothetical protein AXW83_12990 [Bosea sp. PAMC 26642]
MTIRRACAEYLLQFVESNPDIVAYYQRTLVPDESFAHTVLFNSRLFNISKEELRYYDFSRSRHGRSKIINDSDIPSLIQSGFYIARKFDIETHPGILNRVDVAIEKSQLRVLA